MNKRTRDMHHWLRLTLLAAVLMTLLGTLALFAHGQSAPPTSATPSGFDRILPSNAIVPINVINRFFPEATQEVARVKTQPQLEAGGRSGGNVQCSVTRPEAATAP